MCISEKVAELAVELEKKCGWKWKCLEKNMRVFCASIWNFQTEYHPMIPFKEGDRVILTNASTNALLKAQEAFQGVAEELGFCHND